MRRRRGGPSRLEPPRGRLRLAAQPHSIGVGADAGAFMPSRTVGLRWRMTSASTAQARDGTSAALPSSPAPKGAGTATAASSPAFP